MGRNVELLSVFVVFESPSDFPGEFVIRRQFITADGQLRSDEDILARGPSLKAVRALLPNGIYRIPRCNADDAVIVESWI